MALEDREWWREERRQQGHKASWDNFSAKPPSPKPDDTSKNASSDERVERPIKQRTPPSYVHLQAQEILDARPKGSGAYSWLAIIFVAVALNGLAYVYFTH